MNRGKQSDCSLFLLILLVYWSSHVLVWKAQNDSAACLTVACITSCCCWSLLYSAILRFRADSLRSHVILHEWLAFYSAFLNIHRSGVLTALAWLVPHETVAVSAQVLCTPCNHAPCHFMQSHIRKMHACLAFTCHLHFWQNDLDLLRATAVTGGSNGYRNKSQHRKLAPEGGEIPPLLQGFEPVTFQSRFLRSNHWAIPAPHSASTAVLVRKLVVMGNNVGLIFLCPCMYAACVFVRASLHLRLHVNMVLNIHRNHKAY